MPPLIDLPPIQTFAKIDDNNLVIDIIVADQAHIDSGAVGDPAKWIECSTDGSVRDFYPKINSGDYYDPQADAFRPPKPFPSWIWNNYPPPLGQWITPIPRPDYGKNNEFYEWDEESVAWVQVSPFPKPYPVNDQGKIYLWDDSVQDWILETVVDLSEGMKRFDYLRYPLTTSTSSAG